MATGGLYGNTTVTVNTFFTWFVYQSSALAPATPTGGSWNFLTNVGTPPSGWSTTPLVSPSTMVWVSIAFVNSQNPTTLTWTAPAQYSTGGIAVSYPPAGIPNSAGSSWGTSYATTGTGTVLALSASPALTGNATAVNLAISAIGTAPTAALGTSSTAIATTAFAQTMQSPAFTGIPTAPTAIAGTNSTQLATTAFTTTAVNAAALPTMSATTIGLDLTNNGVSPSWSLNPASSQFLAINNGAF